MSKNKKPCDLHIRKHFTVMDHNTLTTLGSKWLKNHVENGTVPNCNIIANDLRTATATGEQPDVIGWCSWASVLIETKISRLDFKQDFKKVFRINEFLGIGNFRYYLVPESLISPDEIPKKWGLLYYSERGIEIIKTAAKSESNLDCERTILLSIIRRKKTFL